MADVDAKLLGEPIAPPPPGAAAPIAQAVYPAPGQEPQMGYPVQGYQQGYAPPPPPAGGAYPVGYAPTPGYAPPPGVYPIQQPNQVIVINNMMWGRNPQHFTCPQCGSTGLTQVEYISGGGTWLFCAGLALIGCWMGCCLIPFCVPDCQDAHHHCPACRSVVGVKTIL